MMLILRELRNGMNVRETISLTRKEKYKTQKIRPVTFFPHSHIPPKVRIYVREVLYIIPEIQRKT